jgi:hypothetical protein
MVVWWLAGCGAGVSGTWSGTEDVADNDGNAASYALDLELVDDRDGITGTGAIAPDWSDLVYDVAVTGSRDHEDVSLTADAQDASVSTLVLTLEGTLSGDDLSGTGSDGNYDGTFALTRQ